MSSFRFTLSSSCDSYGATGPHLCVFPGIYKCNAFRSICVNSTVFGVSVRTDEQGWLTLRVLVQDVDSSSTLAFL